MSDDFRPIRPKTVPLSHAAPPVASGHRGTRQGLTWLLAAALAVGSLTLVFVLVPAWLENRPPPGASVSSSAAGGTADLSGGNATAAEADDDLPPFQLLQRQQARERAQQALADFVERQIRLEEEMSVGAWGAADYQQAKALAAAGDEAFVQERFDDAISQYEAAAAALAELMAYGREVLERAVDSGFAALDQRDAVEADEAFRLAANIAPEDPRVVDGLRRTALLPEVTALLRQARNQELAETWSEAEQTYARIRELDADTTGLDDAAARVAEGRRRERLQGLLSDGFAHLDAGRHEAARRAFADALRLDPGNAVAQGALEQVDKQADVAELNRLRADAERAAAEERWDEAAELYQRALDRDPTLRFAQTGRALAQAQARTRTALRRILDNPERLSSDALYQEARAILARAEQLEPRGPRLATQIADVGTILDAYAEPVPVLLRSDNRTEVTVSSLGVLGSFSEKRLELRPGAYTLVGSRDGCQDVRTQIVVRPNMSPVDIRCVDTF
jgi:tetratricopeptide (TPR) repeat protein